MALELEDKMKGVYKKKKRQGEREIRRINTWRNNPSVKGNNKVKHKRRHSRSVTDTDAIPVKVEELSKSTRYNIRKLAVILKGNSFKNIPQMLYWHKMLLYVLKIIQKSYMI